jgi:hypothetical protein
MKAMERLFCSKVKHGFTQDLLIDEVSISGLLEASGGLGLVIKSGL